jgi:hypothetical protein
MAAKTRSRPDPYFPDLEPQADLLRTPPSSTAERLRHIGVLGQRVAGYVRFMCAVGDLGGSSAEEKRTAVAAFYELLRARERELGRIQAGLRLG